MKKIPITFFVLGAAWLLLPGCWEDDGDIASDSPTPGAAATQTPPSTPPFSPTPTRGPETPTPFSTPTPEPLIPWDAETIAQAVGEVSQENWELYVRQLSGAQPFELDGQEYVLETRVAYTVDALYAAAYLEERLQSFGYEVRFQDFDCLDFYSKNVIATLRGTGDSNDRIVMGAHYDSFSYYDIWDAPGADDNASGTAAVLEAARVLAGYSLETTIDFVLFGAEEEGLCGSDYYVRHASYNGSGIAGAIILDMVGYYEQYLLVVEGKKEFEEWMEQAIEAAELYSDLDTTETYESWGSDHVSFQQAGIPAYLLIEYDWDHPYMHTSGDTYEIIKPRIGYNTTRVAVATLARMARIIEPR